MTIQQAAEKIIIGKTGMRTYRVGFNGNDETELDACGIVDLEDLWISLCPELGCKEDRVDYVELVS